MSTTPELDRHIEQIVNSMIPRLKRRCKQLIESFNGYNNKKYIDVQCGEEYTSNLKNFFVKIIDDILNDRVSSEKNKSITEDPNIDKIASVMTELFIKDYMNFLSDFRKNDSLTYYKSDEYIEILKTKMKKNFISVLNDISSDQQKIHRSDQQKLSRSNKEKLSRSYKQKLSRSYKQKIRTLYKQKLPTIYENSVSKTIKEGGKKKKRKTRKNKKKSYYNGE
jgi:hypothetical protein